MTQWFVAYHFWARCFSVRLQQHFVVFCLQCFVAPARHVIIETKSNNSLYDISQRNIVLAVQQMLRLPWPTNRCCSCPTFCCVRGSGCFSEGNPRTAGQEKVHSFRVPPWDLTVKRVTRNLQPCRPTILQNCGFLVGHQRSVVTLYQQAIRVPRNVTLSARPMFRCL